MLAVELQTLTVWKACSPHPVGRGPRKGTGTEEVWGQKETTAEVAEDRENKQQGRRAGRRGRDGQKWRRCFPAKGDSKACEPEGELSQGHCEFMRLIKQKKFKNLLTITSSRRGWKGRPPWSLLQAGLLPKAVGFFFDLVPAKIHLQRGLGPGSTARSPGGYTRRSCTIL